MIKWDSLLDESEKKFDPIEIPSDDWRKEAAYSIGELYYAQFRSQKGYGAPQRIDLRPGSDFNRFLESHIYPLNKYGVWKALFPNRQSATSAGAIDEALHLLADSKLVERVFSGDIVTVNKIVTTIEKKRAKFLDTF